MIKIRSLTPASRQGKLLLKITFVVLFLASLFHLILGANPMVVFVAVSTILFSVYPLARYGVLNLGALLILLVGFRYVGFPFVAKLLMRQPLDSYLEQPLASFLLVWVGIIAYVSALRLAARIPLGRPLLRPVLDDSVLRRISFCATGVGVVANMAVALRLGESYEGVTVANFFVTFLHLGLIAGIGRAILASKGQRSIDPWVVAVVIMGLVFAMMRNSRMAMTEILLCYVITVFAFNGKMQWQKMGFVVFAITTMVAFLTPVFFFVRGERGHLSWNQRIHATFDAAADWSRTISYYQSITALHGLQGFYLSYYGTPHNVFERMSYINHIDVMKTGIDRHLKVGFEDLELSLARAVPRFLASDKPRGYSQGDWLYCEAGVQCSMGGYATAPLIATGYAAFGWVGAALYPLLLGLLMLLLLKKIAGWELRGNIWVIYLLVRIQNQFVEGSSDAYVINVLRSIPQDLVLLWILEAFAKGRFLHKWRRKSIQIYGT